jgi:hypothetical protein
VALIPDPRSLTVYLASHASNYSHASDYMSRRTLYLAGGLTL